MLKMLLTAVIAALLTAPPAFAGDARLVPPDMSIDPLTMSDAELKTHPEIPPKPDAKANPREYGLWLKSMKLHKNGVREGAIKTLPGHQYAPSYTSSWSQAGASAPSLAGTTTSAVSLNFHVPNYFCRTINSGTEISHWAGITTSSNNLWQAGVLAFPTFGPNCVMTGATLYAFYEDYPYSGVQTFPLTVNIGDDTYSQVWSTGPYTGYAKFTNFTTGQYATVTYTTSWSFYSSPSFVWNTEAADASPARFANTIFYGAASDQYGHIYAPGVYNYSNIIYLDMYRYPNTLMHVNNIGYQYYYLND